jgi:hypothetical protein
MAKSYTRFLSSAGRRRKGKGLAVVVDGTTVEVTDCCGGGVDEIDIVVEGSILLSC